ncbi:MAG: N-acetylmuramoyl-L-alanine amidase [Flavobacteriales bacterium]|nr:N-acetylmuramoyl-L-alanine amidase [Flavobacteriales bacterium]
MRKRNFLLIVILFAVCFSGKIPVTKEKFRLRTVVIDPGHGGKDPGTLGTGRYKKHEKHIALAISLKLGKYINDNLEDVKVIYTRDSDEFIGLKERANIANEAGADLFICIHANSNNSSAPYGTNTYVMGLHKEKEHLEVAKRENSSILLEENHQVKYEGFDPNSPEANIILAMVQKEYLDQSLALAAQVQKQFKERAKRRDRGVKQAGFMVLHQTTMPSILIETGFLTNKEEEKYLNSESGQDYIASAIYRAFKDYKSNVEDRMNRTFPTTVVPKVVDTVGANTVAFRIQIVTSKTKIALDSPEFNELGQMREYIAAGYYKYTVGDEHSLEAARKLQEVVQAKGFKSAFVVAFENERRISLADAIKKTQ